MTNVNKNLRGASPNATVPKRKEWLLCFQSPADAALLGVWRGYDSFDEAAKNYVELSEGSSTAYYLLHNIGVKTSYEIIAPTKEKSA